MDKGFWRRLSARVAESMRGRFAERRRPGEGESQTGEPQDLLARPDGEADRIINVRFYTDFNVCNYACKYCVAGQYDKESLNTDWDGAAFYTIVDNLTRLPFRLNVRLGVGGEFFLNQDLVDGARILSQARNVHSVNLITNLSFSTAKYETFFEGFDRSKLALVASYHPAEVKSKERWLRTARHMHSTLDFAVILVGYPPQLAALPALLEEFRGYGLHVFVQGFIGAYQGKEYPYAYTDDERAILRAVCYSDYDYAYFVEAKQPGLCNSGYKSFYVGMDGVVIPCGMGIPYEPMGNLLHAPLVELKRGPQGCRARTCLCDTENMNTVEFETEYVHTGLNQHKYVRRQPQSDPAVAAWSQGIASPRMK